MRRLSDANDTGQLVRIACSWCNITRWYKPGDLTKLFGDVDCDHVERKMVCQKCRKRQYMTAKFVHLSAQERNTIRLRLLQEIRYVRRVVWRDEFGVSARTASLGFGLALSNCHRRRRRARLHPARLRLDRLKPITEAAAELGLKSAIIDGELVYPHESGRPDFHRPRQPLTVAGSLKSAPPNHQNRLRTRGL